MFGIDDAVVGSLAGTALSSGLSFLGGNKANKEAKKAAEAQMAFQRESLKNRHQWETEDLRKAGLNPILSANSGAPGASGASYQPQNALAGAADAAGKGTANAVMIANMKADTAQKLANAGLASTNAQATAQNMRLKGPIDAVSNTITPWAKSISGNASRHVSDLKDILQNGLPQRTNAYSNPVADKIFGNFLKPKTKDGKK